LLIAGLLGWVSGSRGGFLFALVALLVAGYHASESCR
jgi:hypothetical protein